ncbi:hypothetical protein QBC42DRAFT_261800 [Cladorrhinum samala]|uniref:Uncharacterized protein n=1 Tax=Cladorrhinum samala TaxID=585594 RepID=A0AAV9I094_9PEZI|nr:hypothetical protein QBC42DRAFT_261800 [Cladorrhinum samala]
MEIAHKTTFFRPMECRTFRHVTDEEAKDLLMKGFSPNYKGNPDLDRNRSANIPESENCSLFLVGLAPDLTTHSLLAGVQGMGRVFATHINPPEPKNGHHLSAAKLVFFNRTDAGKFCPFSDLFSAFQLQELTKTNAENFYNQTKQQGFSLPSAPQFRAKVFWNRIRSAEEDPTGTKSRVLLISGPPSIVNPVFLTEYFDTKLIYQTDEIIEHGRSEDGSRALIEFRFGSYRCQAEAARMSLVREFRELGVLCEYGMCIPFPDSRC